MDYNLDELVALVRKLGDWAATEASTVRVETKADNTLVTDIDREIEMRLRESLRARYPAAGFHGEEFGRTDDGAEASWMVDPIDGTTNMVCGIPFWGVSLALVDNGVPTLGVFYMPKTGELFTGRRGDGAACGGTPLRPARYRPFDQETTVGFTSAASKRLPAARFSGRIRSLGSIAAEICYTARGSLQAHAAWREGAVDMAAALCIAAETGCIARTVGGGALDFAALVRHGWTESPFLVGPPDAVEELTRLLGKAGD